MFFAHICQLFVPTWTVDHHCLFMFVCVTFCVYKIYVRSFSQLKNKRLSGCQGTLLSVKILSVAPQLYEKNNVVWTLLETRSHRQIVGNMSHVTLKPVPILHAPIDTLYVKTSLFMASLFMFGKFVYVWKFYSFPSQRWLLSKNSFCAFLARVKSFKTYTQTKNYTCAFTDSHLRVVTDADKTTTLTTTDATVHSLGRYRHIANDSVQ